MSCLGEMEMGGLVSMAEVLGHREGHCILSRDDGRVREAVVVWLYDSLYEMDKLHRYLGLVFAGGIRLQPAKRRDASVFDGGRQSMSCMTGTLGSTV